MRLLSRCFRTSGLSLFVHGLLGTPETPVAIPSAVGELLSGRATSILYFPHEDAKVDEAFTFSGCANDNFPPVLLYWRGFGRLACDVLPMI